MPVFPPPSTDASTVTTGGGRDAYRMSALSKEPVSVVIRQDTGGVSEDPSANLGEMAFVPVGSLPGPSDWRYADWVETPLGTALSLVVGPDDGIGPTPDVTLVIGTYAVWVRLRMAGQTTVILAATLVIEGASTVRPPVVSVSALASYLGIPLQRLNTEQVAAMSEVLDGLVAEAETYLNRDLVIMTWDETITVGYGGPNIFLPNTFMPSDFGFTLDPPGSDSMASGRIDLQHSPVLLYRQVWVDGVLMDPTQVPPPQDDLPWFPYQTVVRVVYDAGLDGPNMPDVQNVIKRAAARELTNRFDDAVGLRQLTTVNLPTGQGGDRYEPGFTDQELKRIDRYREKVFYL